MTRSPILGKIFFKNNSGVILLIVVWTLVILSVLALTLGRNTHMELTLTKHALGKMKSKYLAWAGVSFALELIHQDSEATESSGEDNLYFCGIPKKEGVSPEDLFKERAFTDGFFSIHYDQPQSLTQKATYYGLQDEERKIDINTITPQHVNILVSLISLLGFNDEIAHTVAYSIIDWKDPDNIPSDEKFGAEDEFYLGLSTPYHCKNRPFDSLEELLLVRGMTKEIYKRLRSYVTIFPKEGAFRVNFDTASKVVLQALTHAYSGAVTNTAIADADSLVEKMLDYRRGEDGQELTGDDRSIEASAMPLNGAEKILYTSIAPWQTKKSDYFSAQVTATDDAQKINTMVRAVIDRNTLSIIDWQRN